LTFSRRVITAQPENSETPLDEARSWVTPKPVFFVRNHFDLPGIDPATWALQITGCVAREVTFDLQTLEPYPQRTVFATLECAGNGRSFLIAAMPGVQWGAGAIGHAEWTGVPLYLLLQEAGLRPEALEVVAEGADRGTEPGHPEETSFARSLPLEKALHPDTLVALRMNGEPLDRDHGFPARLIVPGWFGVASVKWLTRIEVVDRPFEGHFQSVKYTVRRRTGRGIQSESIGPMEVKSEILGPRDGEILSLGLERIFGLAWAGEEAVAAVEVSLDGGACWCRTRLVGPSAPYSWTLWEYVWDAFRSGNYELVARAISSGGRVQPAAYDSLRDGYLVNFSRPVTVRVDPSRPRNRPLARSLLEEVRARTEVRARLPLDVDLALMQGGGI
jgi:DMSO/TMAO reductase YedYZ molybdopterin-dependent catalytic subunit